MNSDRRFLLMQAGNHQYAISLEQVAEVCELKRLSPVPRAPAWCMGATRSSGLIVAVVDLAGYIGEEPEQKPEKIVVLDLRLGGLALQVGQITSVVQSVDQVVLEKDEYGAWLVIPNIRAELLDAAELVQEIAAAMGR
jgi:chemotaxis signal transduction protein